MTKYKALIFDIDGTAVILNQYAKPTQKVIDAIHAAKKHVIVSAATGRPIGTARWILKPLEITAPCVITAGTQIIDPVSEKVLWEITMPKNVVKEILHVASRFSYETFVGSQFNDFPASPRPPLQEETVVYIVEIPNENVEEIANELRAISTISIHRAIGYSPNATDLHITSASASKKHAIGELTKILSVKKEEIIGVGDSWNDIALFESVGFKVAMGNGAEKLKESANYIAPSVEEDGLAVVINKFIL